MAKTKKPDKENKVLKGIHDIKKLWKSIPPNDWYNLLNEIAPQYKWEMHGQMQIKGLCPYHEDTDPSFYLSFNKGIGKCFGACEKVVIDLVNFVSKLRQCSYTESLMFLNSRFNLSMLLGDKVTNELNQYNMVQEMKKATAIAMNALMSEVIRDNPEYLRYCGTAVLYFVKGRKLPIESLIHLPIGVLGKPEHLKKYIEDKELHPIFDKYFEEYNDSAYWGSPVFWYNDSPGTISRFKLRKLDKEIINSIPSDTPLSSLTDDILRRLYSKSFIYLKDPYTDEMGLFGLHYYRRLIGRNDTNAYVTEGEFDVLSVMAGQLQSDKIDFMILGTGGKGSTNVGFLTDYGVKTIWLVPDHPAKTGDDYAKGILRNKHNVEKVGGKNLSFKIFTWPIGIKGFDLDEAVQLNTYPALSDYLFTQRLGYFINAVPWVQMKCNDELARVKKEFDTRKGTIDPESETYSIEISNSEDERRKKIKDVVLTWYQYVTDPVDKQAFISFYTKTEDIEFDKIDEVNTSMYSLDTFHGVAKRVYEELSKYFSPAYKRTKSVGDIVCMWAKQDRTIVEINGSDKNTYELIAMYAGCPITDWFNELIGDNIVYTSGVTGQSPIDDERTKRRNAKDIMTYVWELMLPGLRNINDLHKVSQGIHYYKLPNHVKSQGIMYFVNGKYVFKGKFVDIGTVEWELVDNAVDNGVIFDKLLKSEQWSSVEDISELYEASKVVPQDVYRQIRDIIDQWEFKYDTTTKDYLSAYIMSIPIMAAIGDVNITFVTGDPESGKTSLIYGLLGGNYTSSGAGNIPPILEAADSATDATAASIYQTFDSKSLLCVLDEVDQNKYRSKNQSEKLLDLQKQMYSVPMGGSWVKRGGATRDMTEQYFLNMPIIMAGTTVPADSVFLSRIFVIYTKKVPGKKLDYDITTEELVKLRKSITTGLIPYIPELEALRKRLAKELMLEGKEIATLSTRFMECLLTPLTVYEFIGIGKAKDLYLRILEYYKDRLNMLHGTDVQSDIINMCLYTERIKILNESGVTDNVSARSLILGGKISILNNANCGVYYLYEKEWIIIVWRQVKYTLLSHSQFVYVDETAMYEMATKIPFTLRDISDEDHAYISNALGLADVKARTSYSVVDIHYMIRDDLGRHKYIRQPLPEEQEPVVVELPNSEYEGVEYNSNNSNNSKQVDTSDVVDLNLNF